MRRTAFVKIVLVKICAILVLALSLAAPLSAHHLKKGATTLMPITTSSAKARQSEAAAVS